MADTERTLAELQTLLANNTTKDISPQDFRDMMVSCLYGLFSKQILTSSGTYTPTAMTRKILVECVGGGGGGGGAATNGSTTSGTGGSGGGGGYCKKYYSSINASYAYTIGVAGAAGAAGNNNGGNGGDTTFDVMTASGGTGGYGNAGVTTALVWPYNGSGGAGSGGDINIYGTHPEIGIQVAVDINCSPGGGHSVFGRGGYPRTAGSAGLAGTGYGAGGSGGASITTGANVAGGAGTQGLIVVWEFK